MLTIILLIALLATGQVVSQDCPKKIDLLFIIDGSSIPCVAGSCPDWDHILQFVANIVSNFNIGPDDTRVAVVTVSSQGKLEFNFNKYLDKDSLLAAIKSFAHAGGELDSVFSIINVLSGLITTATSQRSDSTFVAVAITDGAPNLHNAFAVAQLTALQALGMNMCLVCVTKGCIVDIAKSISSPPREINKTYYVLDDFSSIDSTRENLLKQICAFKKIGIVGGLINGVSSPLG